MISSSVTPGVLRKVNSSANRTGRNTNLLGALAPCRLGQQFACLDASCNKLDEISVTIGQMRWQTKLADQYNFLARDVDRHHHDYFAADHHVALLHDWTVIALQGHTITVIVAIGFGEHLWPRQDNIRR